jgi:hypothetical protein
VCEKALDLLRVPGGDLQASFTVRDAEFFVTPARPL